MTAPAPPQPTAEAEPAPPVPLRARLALVALLAVAGGWAWAGTHPALAEGALSGSTALDVVEDGAGTRWVAPPEGGDLVVSVRNDGRVPVTLTRDRPDEAVPFLQVVGYRDVAEGAGREGPVRDEVRLRPGREARVLVRAGVLPPFCAPYAPGTSASAVALPLRVRALGLPTTYAVPLPRPVTVTAASAACS